MQGPDDDAALQTDAAVDELLGRIRDEHHLPGLIGAIVLGNRLAATGAVGIRKIGSSQPIKVSDTMHIGSCTKAMTATMIGSLAEAKKLSWTSTFASVFPESAELFHPQFQRATLSHLLTHRAGLPEQCRWWSLPGDTPTVQRQALLTTILQQPPLSRPGSKYSYSNVGYALAGLMAEHVTGESWEHLMETRLFKPLGMASAGFGTPGEPAGLSQPWGHRPSGADVRPTQQDNAPSMGPAGTIHCSVPDWAKFASLHLAGERGDSRLLKPETIRALHVPPPSFEYAGGWNVLERSWAGGTALNHTGSNLSWFANIWIAPARDFAILVATNQGDKRAELACDQAASALIQALPRYS